jgi:large subunit ribosomal protein L11
MEKITGKPIAKIKLRLLANKAGPSPVLGQALSQYGINIMEFCKTFNNQTKNLKETLLIPVNITIYNSNSFEILIKTPSTSYILKNIVGFSKGSEKPKKMLLGNAITVQEIYEIALLKKSNRLMNNLKIKSICKSIIGSIKSMGLTIKS